MTMICERPAEVDDRIQVGHWEGDCIVGAGSRSAIGTLVERRTRFVILIHLPTGRPTAEAMREGITAALGRLPSQLRRTLTWDQGKDLCAAPADHRADRHAGVLLRRPLALAARQQREHERAAARLLPKGVDLREVTAEELARVADEINNRPRKTLDWARPADLLDGETVAASA